MVNITDMEREYGILCFITAGYFLYFRNSTNKDAVGIVIDNLRYYGVFL